LIDSYQDIQPQWLVGVHAIGIAAGASAPEVLVTQVIKFLKAHGAETVEELTVVEENVEFLLPKELLMAKSKR
jgi:4-hydroxy-3-methylbut-2-enyl diphosphate reductase